MWSSTTLSSTIAENAEYIGNLNWKLNNGLSIQRSYEVSSGIAFKELGWASIDVDQDWLYLDNNTLNGTLYVHGYLDVPLFEDFYCFSLERYQYEGSDVNDYIEQGITLNGFTPYPDIRSWYCKTKKSIQVNFDKPMDYYKQVNDINWEAKKIVYAHNTLMVTISLGILLFILYLVKTYTVKIITISFRVIKLALISISNGIAFFVGKIANAIYAAKKKNL